MPNQPKTPNRVVRVDDALWRATQDAARTNGETVSDVIRRALRDYVQDRESPSARLIDQDWVDAWS